MSEMFGMFALRAQRVGETSPSLTSTLCTRKTKMPKMGADRWLVVVALLRSPERESRRLARLLEAWPAEVRRHECSDDVKRRRPAAAQRQGAAASRSTTPPVESLPPDRWKPGAQVFFHTVNFGI